MVLKLGLIKGRHNMPVDDYIIKDEINISLLKQENFFRLERLIKNNINNLNNDIKEIDLYLTGIGRIQHLVIVNLIGRGIQVNIYDYDRDKEDYFFIVTYYGDK